MTARTAFLIALLSVASFSPSSPQEPVYELEGIVVTATRTPERLREIPWGVSVISSHEIELRGAQDLGELLRGELGMDVKAYGSLGQTSTVSLRGSTANQVLVLLDGRPANHIALGIADLSLLSLQGVERVEIVRGPISSLYGANALGGVVNVITRGKPAGSSVVQEVSLGSFDTEVYRAEVAAAAGKVGFLFAGCSRSTQGLRSNSSCDGEDARVKITYGDGDSHQLSLSSAYEGRKLGVPGPKPAAGVLPTYGDSTATSLFDTQQDKNLSSDASLTLRLGRAVDLKAKGYFDVKEMDFFSVFPGYNPDWTTYRAELIDDYMTRTLGVNVQVSLTPSAEQMLIVGLDARRDLFEGSSALRNTDTDSTETTRWRPSSYGYGVWGEGKRNLVGFAVTTTTFRYDWSENYGSFLSPSIGVVLKHGNSSVKLSAGRAFRAPTFNDLYWPGAGNSDLRPESGMAGEVRVESSPLPLLFVSASWSRREVKDLISWAPLGEGGRWEPSNIDRFSETGWEFGIKARPLAGFSLDNRVTLLSAEQRKMEIVYADFVTGETRLEERTRAAAYIPGVKASVTAGYETGFGTKLRGDIRWAGERANYYPNYSQAPTVTMDKKTLPSAVLVGTRVS